MEDKDIMVPYIVYEGEMMRAEKRHFILILILVAALLLSNFGWLYMWTQYDYSDEVITVDGGERGIANYIGNDGDINNGKDYSEAQDPNP